MLWYNNKLLVLPHRRYDIVDMWSEDADKELRKMIVGAKDKTEQIKGLASPSKWRADREIRSDYKNSKTYKGVTQQAML